MAVEITPPNVPGLVGIARVRRAFGWDAGKTTKYDPLLQEWIDAATDQFEADCRQPIRKRQITELFDGNGHERETLLYRPVSNLSKLEREYIFDEWSEIDADAYTLRSSDGSYWIQYRYGFTFDIAYRATFDVGYDAIPAKISALILNAVILDYLDSPVGEGRLGTVQKAIAGSEGMEGTTIVFSRSELRKSWEKIVAQHRKVPGV